MADLFIFIVILSSIALMGDIVERVLTYKQNKEIEKERVIDLEYSEEDIMKANEIYEKILNKIVKGESCEECKNWHPAYYDIDNDFVVADEVQSSLAKAMTKQVDKEVEEFVELNGEKVVYNEEDIMKANEIYEKIMAAMIKQDLESYIEAEEAIKGDDNVDYVELNGEKVVYNEDDQE